MPKVHIYYPVDETGESYQTMVKAGASLVHAAIAGRDPAPSIKTPVEFEKDTIAAVGYGRPITADAMAAAPDLRLIANYTVGFDNIDLAAATKQGVIVTHSPTENNWGGVAEGVMAMMLAKLKKTRERDAQVRAHAWRSKDLEGTYVGARDIDGYRGLVIGLVGFGRIARRVAELLAPWRVTIVAFSPNKDDPEYQRLGVRWLPLADLLKVSDVVSIHCNLTAQTHNLIGVDQLAIMKPNAILINTARGGIVDLDALAQALKDKTIAGAALDVFPEEPPDFSHPIFSLGDEVLLAPHMVANNKDSGLPLALPLVTDNVLKALHGVRPNYIANPQVIALWQQRFGGKSLL